MKVQDLRLLEASASTTVDDDYTKDLDKLVRDLDQKCRPYLELYARTGYVFFRGVTHLRRLKDNIYQQLEVRFDRRPRNTSIKSHELFNLAATQFGNHDDWRSNVLFVTRDSEHAENYGYLHVVVPIDDFECLYSPKISDLYAELDNSTSMLKVRSFVGTKYSKLVTELRRSPIFVAALREYRAALVKIFQSLNTTPELKNKLSTDIIDAIITASHQLYSPETDAFSAFAMLANNVYLDGDIRRTPVGSAGRHGIDMQLDFVSLLQALDQRLGPAEAFKNLSNRDILAVREHTAKIHRILENALNEFIEKHVDELKDWFVQLMTTIFKSAYTYYPSANKIARLNTSNEIMIKCKRYYIMEHEVFDDAMSRMSVGKKLKG